MRVIILKLDLQIIKMLLSKSHWLFNSYYNHTLFISNWYLNLE